MKTQKAIEWLKAWSATHINENENVREAVWSGIQALEEVEQYRALGTVEELKEAREKQVAKKPTDFCIKDVGSCRRVDLICPTCNNAIVGQPYKPNYCKHCGQALKWGAR